MTRDNPMPTIPAEPRERCLLAVHLRTYGFSWVLCAPRDGADVDGEPTVEWYTAAPFAANADPPWDWHACDSGANIPCRWVSLDALGFDPETGTVRTEPRLFTGYSCDAHRVSVAWPSAMGSACPWCALAEGS